MLIQRTNTKKGVTELKVNSAISCYKESSKCVQKTTKKKKMTQKSLTMGTSSLCLKQERLKEEPMNQICLRL
jgi:hypothetical protein